MNAEAWAALGAVVAAAVAIISAGVATWQARSAHNQVTIAKDQTASAWRAANAAEEQAQLAKRQAEAAEAEAAEARRVGDIAERAEADRMADRHDAAGPRFEQERGELDGTIVTVHLRMFDGPTPMRLTIHCQDIPWVRGVSPSGWKPGQNIAAALEEVRVRSSQLLPFKVHLTGEPWKGHPELPPLTVTITAESSENPPRMWTRHVPVRLERPIEPSVDFR